MCVCSRAEAGGDMTPPPAFAGAGLGGAFSRAVQMSVFKDTGSQPLIDHPPDHTIRDPLVEKRPQVSV